MHPIYKAAQEESYANQNKGITIPADELNDIVTIPLGFQPLGIASNDNKIAVASYFEPSILTAVVSQDEKGLHFEVKWIRGVNHGIRTVRLFPDMLAPSEANRAQTVNFGPDDTLLISRNADRNFFVLSPSENDWTLTREISLPENNDMAYLHAAFLSSRYDDLFTIESSDNLNKWRLNSCSMNDGQIAYVGSDIIDSFIYGISSTKDGLYTISDFRAKEHGIYKNNKLAIPDVHGNGICFLPNGSTLITKYGQASPGAFNGEPGALIYIPAHMLK